MHLFTMIPYDILTDNSTPPPLSHSDADICDSGSGGVNIKIQTKQKTN